MSVNGSGINNNVNTSPCSQVESTSSTRRVSGSFVVAFENSSHQIETNTISENAKSAKIAGIIAMALGIVICIAAAALIAGVGLPLMPLSALFAIGIAACLSGAVLISISRTADTAENITADAVISEDNTNMDQQDTTADVISDENADIDGSTTAKDVIFQETTDEDGANKPFALSGRLSLETTDLDEPFEDDENFTFDLTNNMDETDSLYSEGFADRALIAFSADSSSNSESEDEELSSRSSSTSSFFETSQPESIPVREIGAAGAKDRKPHLNLWFNKHNINPKIPPNSQKMHDILDISYEETLDLANYDLTEIPAAFLPSIRQHIEALFADFNNSRKDQRRAIKLSKLASTLLDGVRSKKYLPSETYHAKLLHLTLIRYIRVYLGPDVAEAHLKDLG